MIVLTVFAIMLWSIHKTKEVTSGGTRDGIF
jgi:hypothetical protein